MSLECVAERLSRLRAMREKLCQKEKNWAEAFAARDWIVGQIKILRDMTEDDAATKEDIKDRINDLLCVLDPGDDDER